MGIIREQALSHHPAFSLVNPQPRPGLERLVSYAGNATECPRRGTAKRFFRHRKLRCNLAPRGSKPACSKSPLHLMPFRQVCTSARFHLERRRPMPAGAGRFPKPIAFTIFSQNHFECDGRMERGLAAWWSFQFSVRSCEHRKFCIQVLSPNTVPGFFRHPETTAISETLLYDQTVVKGNGPPWP